MCHLDVTVFNVTVAGSDCTVQVAHHGSSGGMRHGSVRSRQTGPILAMAGRAGA